MTDPVMLLSQLHGEGRVTFRALRASGFFTLSAVAEASIQLLADRAHLSVRTARRLKTGAEELIGKGVGLEPADSEAAGPPRKSRRNGKPPFSEGVSADEAMLLGQCQPLAEPQAMEDEAARPAPCELTGLMKAAELQVTSQIAAAAEVAATLTRKPEPPPRRTFWAFG